MMKKLFGKKLTSSGDGLDGFPALGTPDDGGLRLSMDEVRELVKISAARRGYPEPSHDLMARRVAWLERRMLPGLSAWIFELSTFRRETIEQRFNTSRPDGRRGGACPFWLAAMLNDKLDELTAGVPGHGKVIEAPSHPVLLMPKLAEFLGPHGRLISILWVRDGQQIIQSVMDGYRVAHRGDEGRFIEALLYADKLAIAPFDEGEQLPPMRSGHRDHVVLPTAVASTLASFMRSTS